MKLPFSALPRLGTEIRKWRKPFLILTLIYLVGISAILRANFYYVDDLKRALNGRAGWSTFSRYLSDFFSQFVHADTYLTDVSPLPQLLAVGILAVSALILLYSFTASTTFTLWQYAAVVPLALSPYYLECLSYKYDAPYMALSVLASVAPILFRRKKPPVFLIASAAGILTVCISYQASCGIFPMLVIALSLREWSKGENGKTVLCRMGVAAGGYLLGLLLFKLFLMKPAETYVSNSLDLSQLVPHWLRYYSYVLSDFKVWWLVLIALLIPAFAAAVVKGSVRKKGLTLLVSLCAVAALFLLAFGIYPALKKPLYAPRAMYGFGVLIAVLAVEVSSEKGIRWGKLSALVLAWVFFVFAFTYGNALYVQAEYTDYRITLVAQDLNEVTAKLSKDKKEIRISGSIGHAQPVKNMSGDCRILSRLVPITFCEKWKWGYYGLEHYYGLKNITYHEHGKFPQRKLPLLKRTSLHTIRGDDDYILIELRK